MRDTQREAEGEAGSLQGADAGFDPSTLGSRPEPKADAQPLSHPGALNWKFLTQNHELHHLFEREREIPSPKALYNPIPFLPLL